MIGVVVAAAPLLDAAGVKLDDGVIELTAKTVDAYVTAAAAGRIWSREPALRGTEKKGAGKAAVAKSSAKETSAKLPPPKPAPAKAPKAPPMKPPPASTPALKNRGIGEKVSSKGGSAKTAPASKVVKAKRR